MIPALCARGWLASAAVWVCIVQFAIICGFEAVNISVFTGSPYFDTAYNHPRPATLGLLTALYPVFAGIGSLSTLLFARFLKLKRILVLANIIWIGAFLTGVFWVQFGGMFLARALKGLSIGLITAIIAAYVHSVPNVNASLALTAFQALVPMAVLSTSLLALTLHHQNYHFSFSYVWLIAASPGLLLPFTALMLPSSTTPSAAPEIKCERKWIIALLKCCLVQCSVQLTGINVVIYYVGTMCSLLGFSRLQGVYISMGIYGTNVLATLLSMLFVNRVNRRKTLRGGLLAMSVCHGTICIYIKTADLLDFRALSMVAIGFVYAFVAVFSTCYNGISFVYTTDIAPAPKSVGVGVAIGMGWFTNAVLSAIMPIVLTHLQGLTFLVFSWLCALFYIVL